jgi:hypothetical protein
MFHGFGRDVPSSVARQTHLGRQTCVTQKGPSQWGRACLTLHRIVCDGAANHPPGAACYAQTVDDSIEAPGDTVHFGELLAIFIHQQGRHHHTRVSPT